MERLKSKHETKILDYLGNIISHFLQSLGAYVLSQRAFLRDFNMGVHDYLAGHYAEAETSLKKRSSGVRAMSRPSSSCSDVYRAEFRTIS